MIKRLPICAVLLAAATLASFSQSPGPDLINYQGVLRSAAGAPLTGTYAMIFKFYDASAAGTLLMTDTHNAASPSGAVSASGGLFNATLGAGSVAFYAEPTFTGVFKNHSTVYLEIQVEAETLSPRVRLVSTAYAKNADALSGQDASYYINTSTTSQTKHGGLMIDNNSANWGIEAYGNMGGAHIKDRDGSGDAYIGYGDYGVEAFGNSKGGLFVSSTGTGQGEAGVGNRGINGYGTECGGYFADSLGSPSAWAKAGKPGYGIDAEGNTAGGYFKDTNASGYAYVGYGDTGIEGRGNTAGGYFHDADNTGYAYAGYGDYGVYAQGNDMGGYFKDLNQTGTCFAGYQNFGILGMGEQAGAQFGSTAAGTGYANVGLPFYGIDSYGSECGGYFHDSDSGGSWAEVGRGTYKIYGTGSVSFVQNHPADASRVIVYACPEGDEVAVYTRGTARLSNGEAHVKLGATFQWVANPDLGLTAHLTPHGEAVPLAVVSLSPIELVVTGPKDVAFDYLVFGLRIGFEESSIVQEKKAESPIPSMKDHEALYASDPSLRSYNSLERFKAMRSEAGEAATVDLSRANALKTAIQAQSPAPAPSPGPDPVFQRAASSPAAGGDTQPSLIAPAASSVAGQPSQALRSGAQVSSPPVDTDGNVYGRSFRPSAADFASAVSVEEAVQAGDVLATDPERPGRFRLASASDPGVVGVVAEQPGLLLGKSESAGEDQDSESVPLAMAGIVKCRVDASYGPIRVNDLLVASPTPGRAMRAADAQPGTVLGKALEPLAEGTGLIKALIMLR